MSRFHYFIILSLFLFACAKVNHVADYQANTYELNDSINTIEVGEIDELIAPYKLTVDAEMNQVIGQTSKPLNMAFPESTLGNLIADILYQKAVEDYEERIDFAFINYWSIKIEALPKGAITKRKIFELMPFENHLVIMKVDRKVVLQLFENMAQKGGWPVSKQVHFKIENGKPIDILINGKPLQENYIYHIALSNYLANGGDGCSFFIGKSRDNSDLMIRDMIMQGIIDFTENGKEITANIEGRISLNE